jgi:hypothetical protein
LFHAHEMPSPVELDSESVAASPVGRVRAASRDPNTAEPDAARETLPKRS